MVSAHVIINQEWLLVGTRMVASYIKTICHRIETVDLRRTYLLVEHRQSFKSFTLSFFPRGSNQEPPFLTDIFLKLEIRIAQKFSDF